MVVFPAPFGPKTPKIHPAPTCRLVPLRAATFLCLVSNSRCRSCTSTETRLGRCITLSILPVRDLGAVFNPFLSFFIFRWLEVFRSVPFSSEPSYRGRLGRSDRVSYSTL